MEIKRTYLLLVRATDSNGLLDSVRYVQFDISASKMREIAEVSATRAGSAGPNRRRCTTERTVLTDDPVCWLDPRYQAVKVGFIWDGRSIISIDRQGFFHFSNYVAPHRVRSVDYAVAKLVSDFEMEPMCETLVKGDGTHHAEQQTLTFSH